MQRFSAILLYLPPVKLCYGLTNQFTVLFWEKSLYEVIQEGSVDGEPQGGRHVIGTRRPAARRAPIT